MVRETRRDSLAAQILSSPEKLDSAVRSYAGQLDARVALERRAAGVPIARRNDDLESEAYGRNPGEQRSIVDPLTVHTLVGSDAALLIHLLDLRAASEERAIDQLLDGFSSVEEIAVASVGPRRTRKAFVGAARLVASLGIGVAIGMTVTGQFESQGSPLSSDEHPPPTIQVQYSDSELDISIDRPITVEVGQK